MAENVAVIIKFIVSFKLIFIASTLVSLYTENTSKETMIILSDDFFWQLGGLVVKMFYCCAGSARFNPRVENQIFSLT